MKGVQSSSSARKFDKWSNSRILHLGSWCCAILAVRSANVPLTKAVLENNSQQDTVVGQWGKAPCESLHFFRHTCKNSREKRNRNKSSLSSLTCHQERCGKNWLCANNRSWVIRSSMLCYLGQSETAFWDQMGITLMVITSPETPWCVSVSHKQTTSKNFPAGCLRIRRK